MSSLCCMHNRHLFVFLVTQFQIVHPSLMAFEEPKCKVQRSDVTSILWFVNNRIEAQYSVSCKGINCIQRIKFLSVILAVGLGLQFTFQEALRVTSLSAENEINAVFACSFDLLSTLRKNSNLLF